jgi:hypothetical protein
LLPGKPPQFPLNREESALGVARNCPMRRVEVRGKITAARFIPDLRRFPMSAVVQAPLEMVEAVASLRLPPRTDRRLQDLMDRNNEGSLTATEREDLEALVELSETISLIRAKALHLLGRKPT